MGGGTRDDVLHFFICGVFCRLTVLRRGRLFFHRRRCLGCFLGAALPFHVYICECYRVWSFL